VIEEADGGGEAGIVLAARDNKNFYAVTLNVSAGRLTTRRVLEGRATVLGETRVKLTQRPWHSLRVQRINFIHLDRGGYATFVSKLDLETHPDRPEWLTHVDPGTIKIKLAASLVGISSIHLLKAFVDVTNENPEHIKWKIFIHMTFLGSAIFLAYTDKLMQRDRKH